jgi:2,3-bisphosphoglycerate-dependent phosphoglycerate mutase
MKRIFLVRHGQSQANVDQEVNKRVADHAIELTEAGHKQATAAGKFLGDYISEMEPTCGLYSDLDAIRLWHSPYRRTRQTKARIVEAARLNYQTPRARRVGGKVEKLEEGDSVFYDVRESLHLIEQQFGLFDGLTDEERAQEYPRETEYYEKQKKFEGKMMAKIPLGESRFDVCLRVYDAFGTFHRDCDKHGINTIVIVAHGTVNRAFTQMWLHKPLGWMDEEPNPQNCSVRLLEHNSDEWVDEGYIFEGFKHDEVPE